MSCECGEATVEAASVGAQAQVAAATSSANATTAAASTSAGAQVSVATINAKSQIENTKFDGQVRLNIAELQSVSSNRDILTQGEVQRDIANTTNAGQREIAAEDNASRERINNAQVFKDISVSLQDGASRFQVAQVQQSTSQSTAILEREGRLQVAEVDSLAQRYATDRTVETAVLREQGEDRRLQTKLNYADAKFNLAYGLAQASLGEIGSGATGTPGLLPLDSAPYVTTRGVFTPAQVQQQVNAAYSRNDSRVAAQIRQAQGDLAGRGFSSNSPLLDALKVGYVGQQLRANAESSTQIRLTSAQANAEQVTKGQTLAFQSWQGKQQVALDSEKNQVTRQVGLLGAVAQMVNVG